MTRRRFGTVRYREDRGAWYIQFTWEGRQLSRRVGPNEDEAARVLERIRVGLREIGKPLSVVMNEVFGEITGHKMTFRDAAPHYLAYAETRKKASTLRNDVSRMRVLCRAAWAGKHLTHLTPRDFVVWASSRRSGKRAVSCATVNRDLALASALFKWACNMGYVDGNPVRLVQRQTERGRARTLWLKAVECQALVDAAPAAFRAALLCFLHAGLRRGELINLQWRSVDLDRREIIIEPETTKSGRARHIPLTRRIQETIGLLRPGSASDLVFARPGGRPWTAGALRYWLKKTLASCGGIPEDRKARVTLHALRHTFASHLAQQGVPFQEIAYLLGHSTTYVTGRYAHMAPESGRQAISRLEERLGHIGATHLSDVLDACYGAPRRRASDDLVRCAPTRIAV